MTKRSCTFTRRRAILAGLLALFGLTAHAQPGAAPVPPPARDGHWCVTGESNNERLREMRAWRQVREQRLATAENGAGSPARARIENDIVILDATPAMLPFHHPFDLEGRSVTYTPLENGSFSVATSALAYDTDVGPRLHAFEQSTSDGWFHRSVDLSALEFPFGGTRRSRLFITAFNSIHFAVPSELVDDQLNTAEAFGLEGGLIAPLMQSYQGAIYPLPEVFVKERADAVTVTWRSVPSESNFALDIQARLESSGRIVFSYRTVSGYAWGATLVTTGAEPWRSEMERLFSQGTPASPINGSIQQMLDVRSVAVDRIGGSNLLEITLNVAARVRPAMLPLGRSLGYQVFLGDDSGGGDWIYLHLTRDASQYRVPGWGWELGSPAATIDDNSITFRVLEDAFNLSSSSVAISVRTFDGVSQNFVDSISGSLSLGETSNDAGIDLSTTAEPTTVNGPVVEAFTLGILDPDAVWSELKGAYGLTDEAVDAVAIFQDFFTDLILYAGAYSTVGNPGVDGVAGLDGYGTAHPRSPALLHMNRIGYRWNADLPRSYHVLSHEFGHRWLYFIDIDQGAGPRDVLHPLGGHPAQYVHTPAAFEVYGGDDSSTMGGAKFLERGGGIFTVPPDWGYYGYSWHDLYLMGLAGPDEVADWYYIENSSPPLGGAYYPPPGTSVSGTRRTVSLDDVVRAMGPRRPTVATSRKSFKVVFVLLSLPGTEPSAPAIEGLDEQRAWFERRFRLATGNRAEVHTTLIPVRRRGVRR